MALPKENNVHVAASDDIDLASILDIFIRFRLLFVGVILVFLVGSSTYLLVSPKIYEADVLLQVEEDASGSLYNEISELAGASASARAEMEIVLSRGVLSEVVRSAKLNSYSALVTPYWLNNVYVALGGQYRRIEFPGIGVAQFGLAELRVRRFEVESTRDEEIDFDIYIQDSEYRLSVDDEVLVADGQVDETVEFLHESAAGLIRGYLNIAAVSESQPTRFSLVWMPESHAVIALRNRLRIEEVGRDSGIIRVALRGKAKGSIERILDALANEYVKQNVERRSAEARQSLEFLRDQLPSVRENLEVAEKKIARFRERNRTIDLSGETEALLRQQIDVESKLSSMDLKRTELLRNYTPSHPVIVTLEQQRSQLLKEREGLLNKTNGVPEVQQELLALLREVEVATELYTYLLNKSQELQVLQAGTVGNVRILDSAQANPFPVAPRTKVTIVLGALLGVFFASITVLLREFLRSGLVSPDSIESISGLPVFGVLPFDRELAAESDRSKGGGGNARLLAAYGGESILIEAFRSLRTSIHFLRSDKDDRRAHVIAIAGPSPNVGKTFVAANIAGILSQTENKVLFIDADMRRGDANKIFGLSKGLGLSSIISGSSSHGPKSHATIPNLEFIGRGKAPPNPAELLSSPKWQQLIDSLRCDYDYIVIDTAPVLAVTDPVILSRQVDSVFFVVRAGVTTEGELLESLDRFEKGGTRVRGVILNGMTDDLAPSGAYDYKRYNYEYFSSRD